MVRFDREVLTGFINPGSFAQPAGIELLTRDGTVTTVPYRQVKAVCFVRDWSGANVLEERREFLGRPKSAGLWIRVRFRDGDTLEGTVANDLLLVDSSGLTFVPPEANGNTQRVFSPREAMASVAVLGVIGSPLKRRKAAPPVEQIQLFRDE